MGRKNFWTEDKIRLLKENYPSMMVNELTALLGCCPSTIYLKAKELGLVKNEEYHKKRGAIQTAVNLRDGRSVHPYTYGHPHTKESKRKISEARKELFRKERIRATYGLSRQTKLRMKI